MANIDTYLQAILEAVYGEEVRGSIHDAIEAMNNEIEVWTGLQDGSVTTRKIASEAVTTAKIDDGAVTFDKLSSGAQSRVTSVESQLEDMKTGFDGVVYPSPAAMVQGEDQKLKNILNNTPSQSLLNWHYGGLNPNGTEYPSETRICSDSIPGPGGTTVECTAYPYALLVTSFDKNNNVIEQTTWLNTAYTAPSNSAKIKIALRKRDEHIDSGEIATIGSTCNINYVMPQENYYPIEYGVKTVKNPVESITGYIEFYGDIQPTFSFSGNTLNISISAVGLRGYYVTNWGLNNLVRTATAQTLAVPHASYLVYSAGTALFKVVSDADITAINDDDIICLFNSGGYIKGPWSKYFNAPSSATSMCGYLDQYGDDHPSLYRKADNSIDAYLPSSGFRGYLPGAYSVISIARDHVTPETINVPHNSTLLYSISGNTFRVVTAAQMATITANDYICFYNSGGDAIGPWGMYVVLQKINGELPYYYKSEIASKADDVRVNISDVGMNGDNFIFITDYHTESNAGNSPLLIKYLIEKCGIETVIFGGDAHNQANSKAEAYERIQSVVNGLDHPKAKLHCIVGNHEFNNPSSSQDPADLAKQLTNAEIYPYYVKREEHDTYAVIGNGMNAYYIDNQKQKLRYVFIPCKVDSSHDSDVITWCASVITNAPEGYGVIVMTHSSVNENGVTYEDFAPITNAMDSLLNSNVTPICIISGHTHKDGTYQTSGGVPIIVTTTDSTLELGGLTRTKGTTSEQAFDVFSINTSAKTIKTVRIGAGSNRSITY